MDAPAGPDGAGRDRQAAGGGDDRGRPKADSVGGSVEGAEGDAPPARRALAGQPAGATPAPDVPPDWPAVVTALDEARARGFIGDGQDVGALAEHARGFVGPIADAALVLDLGSGGGVPGLVVAALRPDATVTLLDASVSRTDWLRRVVGRLGWGDRVVVVTGRAEDLAHDATWRGSQDAIVARSFAPPLVTAEVASALLRLGGRLVVSEPPMPDPGRWPAAALVEVGLRRRPWPDPGYAVLEAVAPPRPEVPRARVVRGHTS
jgi:16S rRNA (guanine527-N7)-methyltransferase